MRSSIRLLVAPALFAAMGACGDSSDSSDDSPGSGGSASSVTGGTGSGQGSPTGGPVGSGGGSSTSTSTSSGSEGGGPVVTIPQCDGPAEDAGSIETALPALPGLANVRACVRGDAVNVSFEPVDDAVDYRIYPLPADGDVAVGDDGEVTVTNAIYRCAGTRAGLYLLVDDPVTNDNSAGGATIVEGDVEGFVRTEADATLGWVYATPADDRMPVYVLGLPSPQFDDGYNLGRPIFYSTRPKAYTTEPSVRDALLAANARDDGIAFYVPKEAGAGTHAVYEGPSPEPHLAWIDGPEGDMRGEGTVMFHVLDEASEGAVPLKRLRVAPYFAPRHDELVAGEARFRKVRSEGDHPLPVVRWSGLDEDTVLVVEALDGGCPYQGFYSPTHQDAFTQEFDGQVHEHEAYLTLDEMREQSPTGEVFVNGQYDDVPLPRAIRRSLVRVSPEPAPEGADFHATFPNGEAFRETFGEPTGDIYNLQFDSPDYSFSSYANAKVNFGTMLGEVWFAYSDDAANTNGKVRLTPKKTAQISAEGYLHVSTEMDVASTDRRYPQILVSDQRAPVQDNLTEGTTLVIQPKGFSPSMLQLEVCERRYWDVNNQCPQLPTRSKAFASPAVQPGELTGSDNAIKVDAFISSERVYLFVEDRPYSCTLLSSAAEDGIVHETPSGEVTVTIGDVLYHSGIDFETGGGPIQGNSYLHHRTHLHIDARRHFDNFSFTSGSPPPEWDEDRMPCLGSFDE